MLIDSLRCEAHASPIAKHVRATACVGPPAAYKTALKRKHAGVSCSDDCLATGPATLPGGTGRHVMRSTALLSALAALGLLSLAACTGGAHLELTGERQEVLKQLHAAETQIIEMTVQQRMLTQETDDDDEARIDALERDLASLRALVLRLQAQLATLDRQLAGLVGVSETPPPSVVDFGPGDQAPTLTYEEDHFFTGRQKYIHIGAEAAPEARLAGAGTHGRASLYYGSIADGVSKDTLVSYLKADAATYVTGFNPQGFIRRFGEEPPTVAVIEGAPRRMVEETREAVRIINAALPQDWQLGFSATPQSKVRKPDDGAILVEFIHRSQWPGTPALNAAGQAQRWLSVVRNPDYDAGTAAPGDFSKAQIATISSGRVWIDPRVSDAERMSTLLHELIHTLGRDHADTLDFPDTLMGVYGDGKPRYFLHALDRDALLAVYGRLEPHALPNELAAELGPWESTALQIRGQVRHFDDVTFGVSLRNGEAEPWVFGPAPSRDLDDSLTLRPIFSSSATWNGRLVGFTPATESVTGAVGLTIDLNDLDGDLSFTGMEKWPARSAPGAIGNGRQWGDGDLYYTVAVDGNGFVQTGGDDGTVTGSFFGDHHYLMGGVLQRTDLAAAFGGQR